ncbi:DUF222 domain-containing protein [Mycolicibacterium moriokaense]
MFDQRVVVAALASAGPAAVGAWARLENAACAQRLFASADELERLYAASGSVEREQWCLDNWGAVAASIAAAQHVSLGVASHQLSIAVGLRERLPRVAEVFAAGAVNYRLVSTVVARTRLVKDPDVMAKLDTEIAARLQAWGRCRRSAPPPRSTTGSSAMTRWRCGAPNTPPRASKSTSTNLMTAPGRWS